MHAPANIRNLAIIAHIDHGKTTLIDAIFRAARVFRENAHVEERVMDSNDLERERGITIRSKHCTVRVAGLPHQHHRHPRPRRLQRRGRTRAQHGRLGAAAGRRQRGPHAPDPLRAHARAAPGAATHRHRQQGRPAQRRPVGRARRDLRPVRRAGRGQRAARLSRALRLGPRGLDRQRHRRVPPRGARPRGAPGRGRQALAGHARRARRARHARPLRDHRGLGAGPQVDLEAPFLMQVSTLAWSDYIGRIGCGRVLQGRLAVGDELRRIETRHTADPAGPDATASATPAASAAHARRRWRRPARRSKKKPGRSSATRPRASPTSGSRAASRTARSRRSTPATSSGSPVPTRSPSATRWPRPSSTRRRRPAAARDRRAHRQHVLPGQQRSLRRRGRPRRDPAPDQGPPASASCASTSRCASKTWGAPTASRSRAAASCTSPSSSRRCAARAWSCASQSPR